jgi:ubiquinone/menaquinone biosynthesis C-methylase UbiE
MTQSHDSVVAAQFGPRARAYVESAVHSSGPDLDALEEIVNAVSPAPEHALDLGTGGGHVAYLLARHARALTATDLSGEMLSAVAATARERGLENLLTVEAPSEDLPFDAATFDFAACRFSAHHWRDWEAGLRQARRVLREGSVAVFIDAYSPGRAMLDTHLQAVELLRDTSHVRDYTVAEWHAALWRAGFFVRSTRTWRLHLEFGSWIARMRTPEDNVRAIRALQAAAADETRAHFGIEPDGSFQLDVVLLEATAC